MYRSFRISNFRGLQKLEIDSLERVNLIAGKNNTGKTSLLEALWFHHAPNLPSLGLRVNRFRGLEGIDPSEPLYELFWTFDPELEIELIASGDWGQGDRILKIQLSALDVSQLPVGSSSSLDQQGQGQTAMSSRFSENRIVLDYTDEEMKSVTSEAWLEETQRAPGIFEQVMRSRSGQVGKRPTGTILPARHRVSSQEDAERFGKLEIVGKHKQIESIMKLIEPRLVRLAVIPRTSIPMLHAEIEGYERMFPLPLLGDGMARLASLALAIGNAENGIVLVDEIENGLHYSVMKSIWTGVAQFAREFNVQIIATTHSEECVQSAHEAFSSGGIYDFRLHRLERSKDSDEVRAVTYDEDTLEIALAKGLEVR